MSKNWLNIFFKRTGAKNTAPTELPVTEYPEVKPLQWTEKEAIKEKYSGGKEYFLYYGQLTPGHPLTMLKAFSTFKKWQRSGMKLVLSGKSTRYSARLQEKLTSYKYREDVIWLPDPAEDLLSDLTAAAYAVIYLDRENQLPRLLLNARISQTPVIACLTDETAFGAGTFLPVPADNPETLADHLLLLFKNEEFRAELIRKANPSP